MRIRCKRVLVTAGPTCVPLDRVRVISNNATGKTGVLLAEGLRGKGAKVTLLLGGVAEDCRRLRGVKMRRFRYFDELRALLRRELRKGAYDIVIHSAAVSDYLAAHPSKVKVASGRKNWSIKLQPAPKLIDEVRKRAPRAVLVGFKYEPYARKARLIHEAGRLMRRSSCNLVVANSSGGNGYQAYIVSAGEVSAVHRSKQALVRALIKRVA